MENKTTAAHTPGPWHIGEHSREVHAHGINICRLVPGMMGACTLHRGPKLRPTRA